MKKRKSIITKSIIIALAIILIVGAVTYARFLDSQDSVKKAILLKDIPPGEDYIIVKMIRTTGFDWELVEEDHKLSQHGILCNIKGPSPYDLKLSYDFWIGHHDYVFYVLERREFFDEELRAPSLEYTVSGWDILYPINRNLFELGRTSWHITTKDQFEP